MYCNYNLYFVRLLLFENRVCCENSGVTARLRVARSVPVLTAVVTVVSDSPASSIFHSVLQSLNCFLLHLILAVFFVLRPSLLLGQKSPSGISFRPRTCVNLWPGAAAEDFVDGVPLICDLLTKLINLCFCQTYIFESAARSQPRYFHFIYLLCHLSEGIL